MRVPDGIARAALVTGGSRRLGRAIALRLAQSGFAVAVHCRRRGEAAEATASDCRAFGVAACVLEADLSREADLPGLISGATALLGPLGVLVNNASLFERDEWNDVTRESWEAHLQPNLRAPFVLTQEFARALAAGAADGPRGCVINLLDQRVWSLTPHFVSYTVSKSALWSLTRSMALALAPRIRVNGVGPGPTLPSPRQSEAQFVRQGASLPLGRGTTPDEVADAALALICLPSVTGQMIAVDGGQHLQWHPAPAGAHAEE